MGDYQGLTGRQRTAIRQQLRCATQTGDDALARYRFDRQVKVQARTYGVGEQVIVDVWSSRMRRKGSRYESEAT